ncbi:SixA phosphatase family protein [Nitrincola tapanii]|uniref:SixA phosphatase family protein n=1 Tax=Nitrincola tapanii TaxID=1708751 RepID=UPI001F41CD6E|nr:histidine phosphatase family protein [Nitrincola tapanii]
MDHILRQLILVRHAKSSWKDPDLADFDRPLNRRGRQNLPAMCERVLQAGLFPDQLIYSPARRTLLTAQALIGVLDLQPTQSRAEKSLYECSGQHLLQFLSEQPDSSHSLMLVGHNPGLQELAEILLKERLEAFPTSAVLALQLPLNHWAEISSASASIQLFDYPKLHP